MAACIEHHVKLPENTKACPFCGGFEFQADKYDDGVIMIQCEDQECALAGRWVNLDKFNIRDSRIDTLYNLSCDLSFSLHRAYDTHISQDDYDFDRSRAEEVQNEFQAFMNSDSPVRI